MYPQPPFLIRRTLKDVELPGGLTDLPSVPLNKGADVFISTWNLHRSPLLWDEPATFRPERFTERREPRPEWKDKVGVLGWCKGRGCVGCVGGRKTS